MKSLLRSITNYQRVRITDFLANSANAASRDPRIDAHRRQTRSIDQVFSAANLERLVECVPPGIGGFFPVLAGFLIPNPLLSDECIRRHRRGLRDRSRGKPFLKHAAVSGHDVGRAPRVGDAPPSAGFPPPLAVVRVIRRDVAAAVEELRCDQQHRPRGEEKVILGATQMAKGHQRVGDREIPGPVAGPPSRSMNQVADVPAPRSSISAEYLSSVGFGSAERSVRVYSMGAECKRPASDAWPGESG